MADFSLVTHRQGAMLTAVVRGELDAATAPELQAVVSDALGAGVIDALIDCRGLRMADSRGIGALLAAKAALTERGGGLVLFGPPDNVRRALDVTGLVDSFLVVDA
jgi:anti-sigma B factor antagonist